MRHESYSVAYFSFHYNVLGLVLGSEKSLYTVKEDEGSVEVCIDVLMGTISSGDTYTISYTTANGAAEGI